MTTQPPSHAISRRTALAALAGGSLSIAGATLLQHAAAQDATPVPAPKGVTVNRDVAYGEIEGQPLLLHVYRPPDRDSLRPAVMVFHGGGWTYGISGRADMELPARAMAAAGYVAFNVEYRRTGDPAAEHIWPDQLDDAQRAVRWVRTKADQYGVDPDRIGAFGHSAGAHQASMLGVRETRDNVDPLLAGVSSRVSCVVALAGHFDLSIPYPDAFDREAVTRLLGGSAEELPDVSRDASPLTWVDAASAPFLIIHGGLDDAPHPTGARTMVDALHEAAIDVVYAEFARGDHFSVFDWSVAGPWTLTFFGEHLRPER